MIKTWHESSSTDSDKGKLFNKISAGLKGVFNDDLKESISNKGVKDIATTMMSKKVGKNLYISPNGRKYRRVTPNGQKASKGKLYN